MRISGRILPSQAVCETQTDIGCSHTLVSLKELVLAGKHLQSGIEGKGAFIDQWFG
jgi:hypothetical protein